MVSDLMALSRMASKFPDFDIAGKRMYLEKVYCMYWVYADLGM